MIDYEKLKEAVILCNAIHDYWFEVDFCTDTIDHNKINIRLICTNTEEPTEFDSFDCLITELKKLTEPNPKYKIGDKVWYFYCGDIIKHETIKQIWPNSVLETTEGRLEIEYELESTYCVYEANLYLTKEALIQSKITYWQSLLEPVLADVGSKCNIPISAHDFMPKGAGTATLVSSSSREEIKQAVESVSKPASIPYHRCPHGVICYETENVRMYCEICDNKPAKEECQHEDDGNCYTSYPAMWECIKCGEFYK